MTLIILQAITKPRRRILVNFFTNFSRPIIAFVLDPVSVLALVSALAFVLASVIVFALSPVLCAFLAATTIVKIAELILDPSQRLGSKAVPIHGEVHLDNVRIEVRRQHVASAPKSFQRWRKSTLMHQPDRGRYGGDPMHAA